jgi:hypothetical protein
MKTKYRTISLESAEQYLNLAEGSLFKSVQDKNCPVRYERRGGKYFFRVDLLDKYLDELDDESTSTPSTDEDLPEESLLKQDTAELDSIVINDSRQRIQTVIFKNKGKGKSASPQKKPLEANAQLISTTKAAQYLNVNEESLVWSAFNSPERTLPIYNTHSGYQFRVNDLHYFKKALSNDISIDPSLLTTTKETAKLVGVSMKKIKQDLPQYIGVGPEDAKRFCPYEVNLIISLKQLNWF